MRGERPANFPARERTGDRPAGPSPVLPPVEPVCSPRRSGRADPLRCGVPPAGFTTAVCTLPAIEAVHTATPRSCLLANQREDSPGGPEALPVKNANLVPAPAPQTCHLRQVSVSRCVFSVARGRAIVHLSTFRQAGAARFPNALQSPHPGVARNLTFFAAQTGRKPWKTSRES